MTLRWTCSKYVAQLNLLFITIIYVSSVILKDTKHFKSLEDPA